MFIQRLAKRYHSRRFIGVVAILVVLTLIGIVRFYNPIAFANLVANPGFESGTSAWQLQLRGTGAGNVSTTTSTKSEGAASAAINITSASANPYDVELANYGLPTVAGKVYTVSVYAKASANRTMDIVVQNSASPFTVYMRKTVSLTTSWQQFTYTFTPTESQTNVFVGIQVGKATGTVYVDDVQYFQGTGPVSSSGSNYVQNAGCDSDTTGWAAWQATIERVASPSHSGTGSCFVKQVTGVDYTMYDLNQQAVPNPKQGDSYTASAWMRSDTAVGKPARIVIRLWTGDSYTSFFGPTTPLSTSWQQIKHTVTVDTTNRTGLNFYIAQAEAVSGNSFYADDMQLYAGTTVPTIAPTPTSGAPAYVKAINFNGPQLIVDGITFESESASNVQVSGVSRFENQSVTLNPSANTSKAQMIRSSIWKGSTSQLAVNVPITNGSYNVFLYTWEDNASISYNLAFEGATVETNLQSGSTGFWRKLGPYPVTVADGALSLTQTGGDFNLSGIEIHSANTSSVPVNSTITFRGSTNTTNGAGSTTLVLNKPAGTFPNDVMIAHIVGGAPAISIAPPAGWTLIRRTNSASSVASALYYKVAGASEPPTYTWTLNPATSATGGIASYYNVDIASPIDAHSGQPTESGVWLIAPAVTTSTTGERILFFSGIGAGSGGFIPPTGMTPRWEASGGQRMSYLADKVQAASTSTGDIAGLYSADVATVSHLVALRPSTTTGGSGGSGGSGTGLPGSISNLNFFMSNFNPWIQSTCGDIRIDNGVNIPLPAGQSAIKTNANCTSPGIVYSGDSSYSFGQGQASSTNRVVGGLSYPEVYEPPQKSGIFSSYANVTQKAAANGQTVTPLPCTFTNCTLPNNLAEGIYLANSNLTLNAYTFPNNRNYVILVNGNLTINGNLQTGNGTTVMYIVSGNIIVPANIGEVPTSTNANLEGIFSTDKSLILNSTSTCATERRLNIEGSLIINAARSGGSLSNNRDLCGTNLTTPSMQVTQRLDYILNVPDFLRYQRVVSNEVAP